MRRGNIYNPKSSYEFGDRPSISWKSEGNMDMYLMQQKKEKDNQEYNMRIRKALNAMRKKNYK